MTLDLYRKLNYLEREEQSSEKGQIPSLQSETTTILFGIGCSTVAECMPHNHEVWVRMTLSSAGLFLSSFFLFHFSPTIVFLVVSLSMM